MDLGGDDFAVDENPIAIEYEKFWEFAGGHAFSHSFSFLYVQAIPQISTSSRSAREIRLKSRILCSFAGTISTPSRPNGHQADADVLQENHSRSIRLLESAVPLGSCQNYRGVKVKAWATLIKQRSVYIYEYIFSSAEHSNLPAFSAASSTLSWSGTPIAESLRNFHTARILRSSTVGDLHLKKPRDG